MSGRQKKKPVKARPGGGATCARRWGTLVSVATKSQASSTGRKEGALSATAHRLVHGQQALQELREASQPVCVGAVGQRPRGVLVHLHEQPVHAGGHTRGGERVDE